MYDITIQKVEDFNCYDCVHCEYEEYGYNGVCEHPHAEEMFGVNYVESLFGERDIELGDWIGILPRKFSKGCPYKGIGQVQAVKKRIWELKKELEYWNGVLEEFS